MGGTHHTQACTEDGSPLYASPTLLPGTLGQAMIHGMEDGQGERHPNGPRVFHHWQVHQALHGAAAPKDVDQAEGERGARRASRARPPDHLISGCR